MKPAVLDETPFPEDNPDAANASEDQLRLLNSITQTINTCTTDVEMSLVGPGTFKGPRRCLQHASRTDLFWDYRVFAESRGYTPASYSTFMRVANTVLKPGIRNGHLKFRKESEHAQCDECFRLQRRVKEARSHDAKSEAQKDLHRHRISQWLDRQVYWSFRSMSQTYFSDILTENAQSLVTTIEH